MYKLTLIWKYLNTTWSNEANNPVSIAKAAPATNWNGFHIDTLIGRTEKIYFISQINYIIPGASWQGAYFLYPKIVATSQQERMI